MKQNPKGIHRQANLEGLQPYPEEVAFPPGCQPRPCPPGESWALLRLAARPALPVGPREGAACDTGLISPRPQPCRREVRAGMQRGWEAGDSGGGVEGSGRGQGSLAKSPPPRQCRPLEGHQPATRPGGPESLRSSGGGKGEGTGTRVTSLWNRGSSLEISSAGLYLYPPTLLLLPESSGFSNGPLQPDLPAKTQPA